MKIGLDGFAVPGAKLDAQQRLEFVRYHGLEGAFFGGLPALGPRLDPDALWALRQRADELGLYLELGIGAVNPARFAASPDVLQVGDGDYRRGLERQIRACRAIGCVELRSALGSEADRFSAAVAWADQLQASQQFLTALRPLLRDLGCRINLETHGDATTFELVRLVEAVGPDVVGICLDTANVLCRLEDPVAAVRRAAPYVHQTHTKDAIVYFVEDGLMRQTRPCGEGVIDWNTVLPSMAAYVPNLHLSIEDHKGLYGMPFYDSAWRARHPDLSVAEVAELVRLAHRCEQRIARGELESPEQYEAAPWPAQALDRLRSSVRFLRDVLQDHNLAQ